MISNTTTVLEGLVLYHPMIEIWSGTVRIRRKEDLVNAESHLPPAELVSDGRKRIVPKDPLKPLLTVRKAVERLLKGPGIPMMGGVAVPETLASEIEAELPKLETKFNDAVNDLCAGLTASYQKLENAWPEWAPMLRSSRLTEAEVRSRCRFDVVALRAAAPDASHSAGAAKRFDRIATAAFPKLLEDIAARADEILEESFRGKGAVTQRQLAPVRRLVEKLETFSFLDPRVAPMAGSFSNQLAGLPKAGPLNATHTATVVTVLKTLADPDLMLTHGSAAITQPADVAGDLFETAAPDVPTPSVLIEPEDFVEEPVLDASDVVTPAPRAVDTPRTAYNVGF
jgi:hypothetical protein